MECMKTDKFCPQTKVTKNVRLYLYNWTNIVSIATVLTA